MGYNRQDVERLIKAVRYDLTAAQGRLTELANALAEIAPGMPEAPKPFACPVCGLPWATAETRDEHLANVHGVEVT